MSLGTKIKALRKDRGWSSEHLAKISGCTQSTISDIENDKRSAQYDTLLKISSAFDLSLMEILPIEATMNSTGLQLNHDEKQVIELLHQISPDQRKFLIQLLHSLVK